MLETDVEKELHERLIEFAKKHEKIKAVFKGTSPQYYYEGETVAKFEGASEKAYFFLIGEENISYDDKFEDEITELDLEIHNTLLKEEVVDISSWPADPEEAPKYGFLGECIYKK